MKNYIKILIIVLVVMSLVPSILHSTSAQTVPAQVLNTSLPNPNSPTSAGAKNIPCGLFDLEGCLTYFFLYIFAGISGVILYLTAIIFNFFIHISVAGQFFQSGSSILKVISETWTIFRDLVNMFFIFILIYIGIRTILRMSTSETYRLLGRVILIALLINFSLVITKVVIDASNVLAIGFYQAFPPSEIMNSFGLTDARDVSEPFINAINPQKISGEAFAEWTKVGKGGNIFSILVLGIVGGISNIVIAFIMLAGATLFAIRLVVLIFLMILSPLAFGAYILPETTKYASKWWDTLLKQAFFAPIFMALFYVSARLFNVLSKNIFSSTGEGYIFTLINIIINFSIATGIAIAALIISKSLGAYGASTVIKRGKDWNKKTRGYVGRRTVGRAASGLADSNFMKERLANSPRLAQMALRPLEYVGSDYRKEKDKVVKQQKEIYDKLATDKEGRPLQIQRNIYEDPNTGLEVPFGTDGAILRKPESAQEVYLENLDKSRKKPALSGFKRGSTAEYHEIVVKPEKKNPDGTTTPEVRKTVKIGGKQRRVDRETLLKIKSAGGKSTAEKILDDLSNPPTPETPQQPQQPQPPPQTP